MKSLELLPEPAMDSGANNRTYGGNKAFHNFVNDYSHIRDPNLRRRLALSEIDKVPFGLYHVRAVLVAGVGFFLDSYDIFAVNLITTFLGVTWWQGAPETADHGIGGNYGQLPTPASQAIKASTSAGIVIGQVAGGWLADVFGRRRMYGIELAIILVSTLCCALAAPSQAVSSTGIIVFWRVVMGIGIGADYPLSSVITSEFAPTRWRGLMCAAVFSMQGIGQLLAAIVALCVTVAFKSHFIAAADVSHCDYACQIAADQAWRIIVGVGAAPACFALYYRVTIPETPRYTFDVAHDVEKADADIRAYVGGRDAEVDVDAVLRTRRKDGLSSGTPSLSIPNASWPDAWGYFRRWANLKVLIGTTMSWFFLDLAFYGLGLNNSIVLQAINYSTGPTLYHRLYNNSVGMIILACAGSLPGYWCSVLTIDTLGRKPLQILGFVVLTIIFSILGFAYHYLPESGMLALYVAAQFFFNFGPNTTTFIVPGECFPTRYRSTGHGISAAMGKVGAIAAQLISIPLLQRDSPGNCSGAACSPWLDRLMQIFALFMLLGTLVSLLIPETKGITLEELAGEPPHSSGASGGSSWYGDEEGVKAAPAPWWNIFAGGRPAGFRFARKGSSRARGQQKSPRIGIMTSPKLAAQGYESSERPATSRMRGMKSGAAGWRRPKGGGESSGSNEFPAGASSTASSTGVVEAQGPAYPASVLPGWGAGWGRVDRGGQQIDDIRLHDVGRLLR